MISDPVLPDIEDPDTAPFWEAAKKKTLVIQRCDSCGTLRFTPRPRCGHCREAATSWVPVSGRGTIWSYAVVHGPVLPAYEPFVPFPVAVITLEEGDHLRMVGNIVADEASPINSVDVSDLAIGLPVEVVFQEVAPDVVLPRWQLVKEGVQH